MHGYTLHAGEDVYVTIHYKTYISIRSETDEHIVCGIIHKPLNHLDVHRL